MKIQSIDEGQVAVLTLSGVLRMGRDTEALRQAIDQVVEQDKNQIVLDIANLSYIDSSGVSELVRGLTKAKKSGGTLKLAAPTDQVREVLKVTHLLEILDTYKTRQEALDSFQ